MGLVRGPFTRSIFRPCLPSAVLKVEGLAAPFTGPGIDYELPRRFIHLIRLPTTGSFS